MQWVLDDSRAAPSTAFDDAVMSGNVAQHIPDGEWERTLVDIRSRLAVGGVLAFESRNPLARAWERWEAEGRTRRSTVHGPLEEWTEIVQVRSHNVEVVFHNVFVETNDTISRSVSLAFRDRRTIEEQLETAGFSRTSTATGSALPSPTTPA